MLQEQLDINQLLLNLDALTIARLLFIQNTILWTGLSKPTAYNPFHGTGSRQTISAVVGPDRIVAKCGHCGTLLKFKETDARNHVNREFASEINNLVKYISGCTFRTKSHSVEIGLIFVDMKVRSSSPGSNPFYITTAPASSPLYN